MKHTPGPWKQKDTAEYGEIFDAEDNSVCIVASHRNMELIAAAPELYEALEQCVEELLLRSEANVLPDSSRIIMREKAFQANKALLKARGETQEGV